MEEKFQETSVVEIKLSSNFCFNFPVLIFVPVCFSTHHNEVFDVC